MADDEELKPQTPQNEPLADDEPDDDDDGDQTGHDRIWASPIGTGDVVPFDPTKFKPRMSKEERDKILKGDGP